MRGHRPKVLVDFDGVWTAVTGQAHAVDEARGRRLAENSGLPAEAVARCEEIVAAALAAEPLQHGWRIDGRLTAYADEDPFLRHNALVNGISILAEGGQPRCRELQTALAAAGHTDLGALASAIFMDASAAYLDRRGHDLLPEAPGVLAELLALADVVFCTNFTPDAVARSWEPRGFRFSGPEATGGLTLRGLARKQQLTSDPPREVVFGGRPVAVDRAFYRAVLETERPGVVVGDVFSLDLALPLAMATEGDGAWAPACVLMLAAHTPAWSRGLAEGGNLAGLQALSRLSGLPQLVTAAIKRKGTP